MEWFTRCLSSVERHILLAAYTVHSTPLGCPLKNRYERICFVDLDTIVARQKVVAELTSNEPLFFGLSTVIGRFLNIEHLLSQVAQISKQESAKTAEAKIAQASIGSRISEFATQT